MAEQTDVSTSDDLMERVFDANMRVEKIAHLGPMSVDMDDDFFEWLTEYAAEAFGEAVGAPMEEVLNQYGEHGAGRWAQREILSETVAWRARDKWIVEAATPVLTPVGKGSYSMSWGNYVSKCFVGDTYEQAVEKAVAWAESKPAVREAK